jgi:transcriptional/translational regulatory protein YebC/TACO1
MVLDQAQEGRRRRQARPVFTKLARAIQVAAREGGGDPAGNAALATAVQKARG